MEKISKIYTASRYSLVLVIPKNYARSMGIKAGDNVIVKREGKRLVVRPHQRGGEEN